MKILETSSEYKLRESQETEKNKCPECGYKLNFGMYRFERKSLFSIKSRKIHTVRCFNCGCQYEFSDEWS